MNNNILTYGNKGYSANAVKILLLSIFLIQVFIVPFFLNFHNEARALFFIFLLLAFIIVKPLDRIYVSFVDILLFIIVSILFISTFYSPQSRFSYLHIIFIACCFSFRHYLSFFLEERVDPKLFFLKLFSVFSLSVSILGLYEYFHFILCGASVDPLIPYLVPPDLTMRVVGIYGQPNFTALLLLIGILVYIYLYLHDASFKTKSMNKIKYVPFFLLSLVFYLTGSRAGFLALNLTVLLIVWLVIRRVYLVGDRQLKSRLYSLLFVLGVAYFISIGLNQMYLGQGGRQLGAAGIATDSRFLLWTAGVLIFFDHPWLGVGLDNFKFYLPKYANQAHDLLGFVQYEAMGYTRWAHNELLQLACEGGLFVFLMLLFLIAYFVYLLWAFFTRKTEWTPLKLYCHIFIIPFVIQSMFSWPLRYSSITILFVTFCTLLLSEYNSYYLVLGSFFKNIIRLAAFGGVIIVAFFVIQEMRMGSLVNDIKKEGPLKSFPQFEKLISQPYTEYALLTEVVPRYVHSAILNNDAELADKVLPYIVKLTEIQGAHWQWFYLAHTYLLVGNWHDAMKSVTRAIELWPTEDMYWGFQHYLNMLKASEKTGKPVDDFWPVPPGKTLEDVKGIFDFGHRIKFNQ